MPYPQSKQAGSTLLEGLIAIAIFSIGLLGLAAFQLTAMRQGQQARYRAMASFYAEQILSQAQSDVAALSSYISSSNCTAASNGAGGSNFVSWCTSMKTNSDTTMRLPITSASVSNNSGTVTVSITWKADKDPDSSTYTAITNVNFMQAPT